MVTIHHCRSTCLVILIQTVIGTWLLWTPVHALEAEPALLEFSVTPVAQGRQLVRASLPFAEGALLPESGLAVDDGSRQITAAVRPLGWHIDASGERSVRTALVTFPYEFDNLKSILLRLKSSRTAPAVEHTPAVRIRLEDGTWLIEFAAGEKFRARPIWPDSDPEATWQRETVEDNAYFRWQRWKLADDRWNRIVEFRCDQLGQVVAVAHLQRKNEDTQWAPTYGWELTEVPAPDVIQNQSEFVADISKLWKLRHSFAPGHSYEHLLQRRKYRVTHPSGPFKRRGGVFTKVLDSGATMYRYLRSTPADRVPMQPFAWRRAEVAIGPTQLAPVTPLLTSSHDVTVSWRDWDAIYQTGEPVADDQHPLLSEAVDFHRQALLASVMVGHDWGNLSAYVDGGSHGGLFGMNRLNHAPALMFFGLRSGEKTLIEAALAWCDNFHDLTIWWGPKHPGGTRYPSLRLGDNAVPDDDTTFTWRGSRSCDFCTKGYDTFLLAYEQTGDPRMKEALDAQVQYAMEHVHADADNGECRNIGDVIDFVRLYELTGQQEYLDHALRLFRELRSVLSTGTLFSQGGKPLVERPPYIDEDDVGYRYPFPKPYIIGYALAGCPRLASYAPDELKLVPMIEAVADFMAESQDPLGGWRYPHPRSSRMILSQAIEHARQLVQAAKLLGPREHYLDAIERVLRQRLWVWKLTGQVAGGLEGWEFATGHISHPLEIYRLYKFPKDRDGARDYREGRLTVGSSSTEGLVYFPEVLSYYLEHRPISRLLVPPSADSPLGQTLAAAIDYHPGPSGSGHSKVRETTGIRDELPIFSEQLIKRMKFPIAWENATGISFDQWRTRARRRVRKSQLAPPPPAVFATEIVDSQNRNGYKAHKVEMNLSSTSRVLAYLLVPDGEGPFPAVLLLHDHGAEFRIGKEKLVRAWDIPDEKKKLATAWVDKYYGGRFLADHLAQRGYVCLVTDALNWSDRGGGGFDGQQAIASNLMHMGMSLAGLIAHDDLRAAEFLALRPEVDRRRIGAVGLSMGAFRTWQLAAASDHIAAGAAICWMATVKGLLQPDNNQTKGHSSYTMLHPGLLNYLDYPDVASLACPKPMLFYNGRQDHLFPVPSVEQAYEKMRSVWLSQRRGDVLETRLWDVPHEFNAEMQDAAFAWLHQQLTLTPVNQNQDEKSKVSR